MQARRALLRAQIDMTNRAILTLNWLHGGAGQWAPPIPPSPTQPLQPLYDSASTDLRCSAAALRLQSFVFRSCADFVRRRGPLASQRGDESGALASVLQSLEELLPYGAPDRPVVVPLRADAVSLPADPPTVDLLSKLPPGIAALYADPTTLLRPDLPALPQPASRPRHGVGGSSAEYRKLILRLQRLRMVDFTTAPLVVNGVFAVPKPNDKQRLIIDARPANAVFVPSPPVKLPSPADFAAMEASGPFWIAGLDVSDFFHRLRLPPAFRPYFALPPIPAAVVGRPEPEVWPMCTTLPMGWSHSVFVAQAVHEYFVDSDPALRDQPRVGRDRRVDPAAGAHSVYIDDFNVLGQREHVEHHFANGRVRYPAGDLPNNVKKDVPPAREADAIGLHVDGGRGRLEVPISKITKLLGATAQLLRMGGCSGHDMARLVGHWTWVVLVRRPALSVFNAVYRFVAAAGHRVRRLWPSVRSELHAICALAPLLWTSVNDDWFDKVVAFDASTLGAGVCSASATTGDIADEQAFFVRNGAAVSLDGVLDPGDLQQAPLEPALAGAQWSTIISRRWRWDDHINLLEVQAAILAMRWVLSHPRAMGSRVLLLGDSQVALGCLAKGRSSSYRLLRLLRRAAALILASGLRPSYRWLPSAANPADGPSRLQ